LTHHHYLDFITVAMSDIASTKSAELILINADVVSSSENAMIDAN